MFIAVAMSGGVDSSTTAGLLVEAGHKVVGLAIKTHQSAPRGNRACCTPDDMRDARDVADQLGIELYVLNYAELFEQEVIAPFAKAYLSGQTPNPCVACNEKVKFGPLLARARLLGAEALATGHYAQLYKRAGRVALVRAKDAQKDQSYFLARLQQEQLERLMFPIGHLTKPEVRDHAKRLGLDVAEKRESQEICFVGPEGYAKVVEKLGGKGALEQQGEIVDETGRVIGQHQGVHHYTVGQRRGLKLAHPEPRYVTHLDAQRRQVRVGRADALVGDLTRLTAPMWLSRRPEVGAVLSLQQRHRGTPEPTTVLSLSQDEVVLRFSKPTVLGAPGQAGALFDGDEVVGSGFLARAEDQGANEECAAVAP